jgi:hypothetical protein
MEARLHGARCLGVALRSPVRMATGRFRVGYPRVSGLAGSGSGMISHPWFSVSGPRNQSGSVSGGGGVGDAQSERATYTDPSGWTGDL